MPEYSSKNLYFLFKGSLGVKPSRSRGFSITVCSMGCPRAATGKQSHSKYYEKQFNNLFTLDRSKNKT